MNKKIIIIEGYLASGKSTFALQLSNALNIPYLMKDTFKSAICTSIQINNREVSRRFSAVTFDAMIYVAERLFETGYPIIIEGNFVPAGVKDTDEEGVIRELISKYKYSPLTYELTGDLHVLHQRFIERDKLPERGQANIMFTEPTYDYFENYCHDLDGFQVGGEIIKIDTTDFNKVNFEKHIHRARLFLDSKYNV